MNQIQTNKNSVDPDQLALPADLDLHGFQWLL